MRLLRLAILFFTSMNAFAGVTEDVFHLKFELSPIWQSVNRVQIPSPGGTRFDFTSLGSGPAWSYRIDFAWKVGTTSELRALYAPLSINLTGKLGSDVNFQNNLFLGTVDTEGLYRFNSYRLTYRYRLVSDNTFQLWIGVTGKIRDAEIRLTQGALSATRSNVGFVPLLHLLTSYEFTENWRIRFEMDALAAPQGRAEDIGLLLGTRLQEHLDGFIGYRTVEGGSDGGGEVYNFAWLHYAVLALSLHL